MDSTHRTKRQINHSLRSYVTDSLWQKPGLISQYLIMREILKFMIHCIGIIGVMSGFLKTWSHHAIQKPWLCIITHEMVLQPTDSPVGLGPKAFPATSLSSQPLSVMKAEETFSSGRHCSWSSSSSAIIDLCPHWLITPIISTLKSLKRRLTAR